MCIRDRAKAINGTLSSQYNVQAKAITDTLSSQYNDQAEAITSTLSSQYNDQAKAITGTLSSQYNDQAEASTSTQLPATVLLNSSLGGVPGVFLLRVELLYFWNYER